MTILDPPFCAASTALMINDIILCAQNVVAMTGDCMGELESPPDCAADITSFMANLADAAEAAASLSMGCAGESTACEVSAIDAVECFSKLASDLVGASTNCDIDAFLCTINLVDAMKQIFGAAVDIQSAADTCPKESTFVHYLRTVKYPDWPGWNYIRRRLLKHAKNHSSESDVKVPTVSSLYKAVTGSDAEFVAFDGGKTKKQPPHVGILDQSVGGPIIAADETGYVRVGTALAVPTSSTMVDMHGNGNNGPARRLEEELAVELPTLHEMDIDIWHVLDYPQDISEEEYATAFE